MLLGSSTVVVVDRIDGRQVTSLHLPYGSQLLHHATSSSPSPSLVTGDLNNDGYADIAVSRRRVEEGGEGEGSDVQWLVLVLSVHRGSALFPRLVLALTVALAAVLVLHFVLHYSPRARQHVHTVATNLTKRTHAA